MLESTPVSNVSQINYALDFRLSSTHCPLIWKDIVFGYESQIIKMFRIHSG